MSKTVAIVQSNYIPWKGYFDLINSVDEFILFDDMQYTVRDWRNRNRIKTPNGPAWLTIPVNVKGKRLQKISETTISQPDWNLRHWASFVHNYSRAKCFGEMKDRVEGLFLNSKEEHLSEVNHRFIKSICDWLGIRTILSWSHDYTVLEGKTERLVHLCKQAHATEYLSGPSARDYLNEELFHQEGIQVRYMDYSGYPEYPQLYPPFEHAVSILDLVFNTGQDAKRFMLSF
jgi:hypothetical protein